MAKLKHDAAMGDSGLERRDADFYPTPPWLTELGVRNFLDIIAAGEVVYECACGDGRMAEVLKHTYTVIASDLHDRGYAFVNQVGVDFLKATKLPLGAKHIITNPPYGDVAEEFIRHALELTKATGGSVAMLLRNEYDCAKERIGLFNDHPAFVRKIVSCTRPRWIDGTTGSPRHVYAWYVWSWAHSGPHQIVYDYKRGR